MKDQSFQSLRKQLLLVAAAQGMIFWYAIEKLYYLDKGVTLQTIVILGIIAQGSKIAFELPTSVFADRWSRRSSLIASNIFMVLASLVIGLSSSFGFFAIGIVLWSFCDALRSGVYEAFAYDSLKMKGWQGRYRKVYTRMVSAELLVMTFAGLAAGILGRVFGLQMNFFITLVPVATAILVLLKMQEPPIVRTSSQGETWWRHLSGAAKILHKADIRWVVIINTALMGFTFLWYEYYQLIGVNVHVPRIWFGALIACVTLGMTIGAELAHRFAGSKKVLFGGWLVFVTTLVVGMRSGNILIAIANMFVLSIALRMIRVYAEVYLQDRIPSSRRATIFSLAGTVSYVWFFLFAGLFSLALTRFDTRITYTLASIPILLIGLTDIIIKRLPWSTSQTAPLVLEETDHVASL